MVWEVQADCSDEYLEAGSEIKIKKAEVHLNNHIMKKTIIHLTLLVSLIGGMTLPSCKNKKADTNTNTTTVDTTNTAPVVIANDDELTKGVNDATKDFPGVTASVNNGEVTLTGTIKRDRLPTLMQSINSLHPKKVNNNLTIQP